MKLAMIAAFLFALLFPGPANAEPAEMPNALQQDETSARWLPLRTDDCLWPMPATHPPMGFVTQPMPKPCLTPRYQLMGASNNSPPVMPLSVPPVEKTEPTPRPVTEQPGLVTVLSSNGLLLRSDLSLPIINLVGMTVLPRSFGKHISLEKDWRTSQGLLRVHADIGRLHPFVEGSFLVIDGRIVNILMADPNPSAVLREDRRLSELLFLGAERSPYWFGGVTVDLGRGFALGIGGTAITVADRPFYAGALILTVPLRPVR